MNTVLNPPAAVRDVALLIARVLLGTVLIAHGAQKFFEWTIAGTTQAFGQMGVPFPALSAPVAAVIELVGGALLLVGAFSAIAGLAVALNMAAAAVLVHVPAGVYVENGGWELVGVIAAAALAVGVAGAGRFSVDALLSRKTSTERTQARERQTVNA